MFSTLLDKGNPIVFLDVSIDSNSAERLFIELFSHLMPKTAENFRQLCCGEVVRNGKPIGYKNTFIHRIVKGYVIQGGDFVLGNGKGSYSIYGETFPDEGFNVKHNKYGIISMANTGPNTNGCQFFFTLGECSWLDGKHVAFGRLVDTNSVNILKRIELIPVNSESAPLNKVEIVQCGQM